MKYTLEQFNEDFPNDNVCLEYIFKFRYKDIKCPKCSKILFYRVKNRKSFACSCGYQINPTANTIFHKSNTSLKDWFFAIYLFSVSKNRAPSTKELQRRLEVTYKTAWRIAHKIKPLIGDDGIGYGKLLKLIKTYNNSNDADKRSIIKTIKEGI